MTPQANTLYAVCLYLALCCLLKWTARRHRVSQKLRSGLSEALAGYQRS
jgi:hypothetical protein